ncbi:MAG TPA: lipopolysaccharide heptosyltransferase II [Caldimonas sp.]|nr:lipopolysaccharide heptosyltransferase II [Caldimonas sp.]HEX4233520.1 lipopolysaccharide heptosyltransferase II [Caldimonas sp.]
MTRTLVVAPQWIGDAVMAEPLLATLAERGDAVTVATLPWVAPVFEAMPEVTATVVLPFAHGRLDWSARRRVAASLRGRFDAAYVLPNSFKAALLPWLAKIPRRVGYRGEGRALLLTERHEQPRGRPPMVPFYGVLAGDGFDARRRPRLQLPRERIAAVAAAHGLQPTSYWTFAPGAEYGPAKRWPAPHYAALARALHARDHAPVVLLGSPGEAALCDEIAAQAAGAGVVLAGRASLVDAIALIAGSRGLASNDSGLMHVAAGLGVAQVAVFGSTSPLHTPPLNERARVVWLKDELQLGCMPCFDRTCRFGHYRCLTAVTPDRVLDALDAVERPSTAPLPRGGSGWGGSSPDPACR